MGNEQNWLSNVSDDFVGDRYLQTYEKSNQFDLSDDTFERTGRVHDWRNHVPPRMVEVWHRISEIERYAAAYVAQYAADQEEWEE